jgi:hypothetical protein
MSNGLKNTTAGQLLVCAALIGPTWVAQAAGQEVVTRQAVTRQLTASQDDHKGLVKIESEGAGEARTEAAVELQTGQQYTSGTRVESVADGVSFVIPAEWLGGLPPDAAAFMLGSNTRHGLGMVIMRSATSWQEIEQFLGQPQDLGEGVVLRPISAGRRTERGYEISLANHAYAGHAIGRIGEQGNGVIVFFGGPATERDDFVRLAAGTADSVVFAAPRESAMAQQWRAHLAGMMLRRSSSYYSGGTDGSYVGSSSSQSLHLCSDGSYVYLSRSSVAADAGGGTSGYNSGDGAQHGQWSVETIGARVLLSLRSTDGESSQHALQVQGEYTYVDGERALRVRSERCR